MSEEVWASDEERIDLVVFLNGLAIMAFELKCNAAGQNYENAILQYRTERNPKTRLFRFKAGVLVSFAMDLEEVYMTTKLDGEATFFLPFNMGKGEGINTGAGNPVLKDEYSVHYMWDNILQKDSVLEIISKFIINFKPGNPIPLGAERKGSFFTKKIKNLLFFLLSPEKSSILNMTEQKSKKSAERRRANGSKRAKCNDINKGKVVS